MKIPDVKNKALRLETQEGFANIGLSNHIIRNRKVEL